MNFIEIIRGYVCAQQDFGKRWNAGNRRRNMRNVI